MSISQWLSEELLARRDDITAETPVRISAIDAEMERQRPAHFEVGLRDLRRIAAAALDERERSAKIADAIAIQYTNESGDGTGKTVAEKIAAKIRSGE